jgi:hypothetical protein
MINLKQPIDVCNVWLSELQQVALANGPATDIEKRMLGAAAKHLGVTLTEPRHVSDDELANTCPTKESADSLLQLALLVTLADKKLGPKVLAEIERIQRVTGADDPFVKFLTPLYAGHHKALVISSRWRSFRPSFIRAKSRPRFVVQMVSRIFGLPLSNRRLAAKYDRLGSLPAGTFGQLIWKMIRENNISFPGEPKGPPEESFHHDCSHVISDYNISLLGELLHAFFIGGYNRTDPIATILVGILQCWHGVPVAPGVTTSDKILEPELMFEAYQRGVPCKVDLTDGFDVISPYLEDPIDVAREKLGIPPRTSREASFNFQL